MTGKNHQPENDVDIWSCGGSCKLLETGNWSVKAQSVCPVARAHTLPYIVHQPSPPLLNTHPHLLWPVFTHIPKFWCWELPTCLGNYSVTLSVRLILQHPPGMWDTWNSDISFNPEHCGKEIVQTAINISSLKQKRVGFFNDSSPTRLFLNLKLHK